MEFKLLSAAVDYKKAEHEYKTNVDYRAWRIGFRILFGAISFFGGLAFIVALAEGQVSSTLNSALFVIIGIGAIYLFRFSFVKGLKEGLAYKEFAQSSGLGYVHNKKTVIAYDKAADVLLQRKGVVFGHGRSTNLLHAISNNVFAIYTYSYVTGSGKNSKTHYWTILAFKLKRNLPHVLFDNKKNNFWRFSNLPSWFQKDQKVSLGAAVDEYFDLYSPEGYQIDALSYLTPEVLELLINEFSQCDVEVIDDLVYVYQNGRHKREAVPALYARIITLGSELNQNTRAYNDDRMPRTISALTSENGQHTIAHEGRRLKKNKLPTIIGATITIAIIGLQLGVQTIRLGWFGIFLVVSTFTYLAVLYVRHKKQK